MEKIEWEDLTCYSQNERRGATQARVWRAELDWLTLVVTRRGSDPGVWFLRAYNVGILGHALIATELADAKVEALSFVARRLSTALEKLL